MGPKVTGNQLTLTYTDESNLDAANTAAASAFAVSSAGNAAISVNSVAVSGKTVTLTLSRTVTTAETVTVSYTKPTGNNVIQDASGNDAVSFSNQAVTHGTSAADTTPPVLITTGDHRPKVTGNQLTLTYTDASNLDAVNTAAASAFAVSSAGNAAISVNSVAVSGKTVTLTLSRTVATAETVTVSYTKPTGDNVVQDAAGNDAVSFSNQAVTHGTSAADTTPPVLITTGDHRPKVTGNQLTLTYTDESNLDAVNTAAASAFAVSSAGNAAAISVNSVAVSGKTVTLTLSRTVATAETVTVSYTKPTGDNVVQDTAGNDAVSFSNQAVTHGTTAADTTPPVLITTGDSGPKVTGNQLTLTYTDASNLDAVNTAAASAFAVSSAGNAAISVNSVAVSGKTVTLTLSRTVATAETVTVSYTKPTGDNVVQDAAGNDAVSFSNQAVTHGTSAADTTPPVLITTGDHRPKVTGNQLTLTYTDASNLDAANTAAASAFAVSSAGNAAISVNSVAVSGKTVTLTLSRVVTNAETTVTVSYTKPTGDNVIQDAAGNDAPSFAATEVTNNTPAPVAPPPAAPAPPAGTPSIRWILWRWRIPRARPNPPQGAGYGQRRGARRPGKPGHRPRWCRRRRRQRRQRPGQDTGRSRLVQRHDKQQFQHLGHLGGR
ncbi:SwmB domain-containing protein [Verminephrobacter aporrectodeae]|uniref:SwmB domain-containing protein n=1 Tax=Verminephrobacter aporrectodeae TaxID=1110389 RepID=UPI002238DB88|nr:SwmB domain-containing protein [Verminephrobacter aporrectodeae]